MLRTTKFLCLTIRKNNLFEIVKNFEDYSQGFFSFKTYFLGTIEHFMDELSHKEP